MIGDRRGFVLMAVLWLLVALSAVGIDASIRHRTERLAAANTIDGARAQAVARAGAEYARSRLTAALLERADELRSEASSRRRRGRARSVRRLFRNSDPSLDPWREPDELLVPEGTLEDAHFRLRVRDAGAALNLNEAEYESLRQFFAQGLRIDVSVADAIANAIVDWRDEDDLPWPNGGERDDYIAEGRPVLPANRAFAEVDELQHVRGVTPEIFGMAEPYLRVVGSEDININAAPEPVLLSLPGMTPPTAAAIVALRDGAILPEDDDDLFDLLGPGAAASLEDRGRDFDRRVDFDTREVEILSQGWVEGSPVRSTVHLVVARSEDGARVVWRRAR